jgi:hypothetical protein
VIAVLFALALAAPARTPRFDHTSVTVTQVRFAVGTVEIKREFRAEERQFLLRDNWRIDERIA